MTNSYHTMYIVNKDKMEVFHFKKFKIERLCENKNFTSVEMLFGNLVHQRLIKLNLLIPCDFFPGKETKDC